MDYMASMIEKIIVERNEKVDSIILGEIQQIAIEEGLETKIILNKKNVADALRNFRDGYATVKAEVAREIFAEIESLIQRYYNDEWYTVPDMGCDIELLKQKYTEVDK